MHDILLTLVVTILGSNGIVVLINRYFANKDEKKEDTAVIRKAVESLTHDAYFRHCRLLLPKDVITEEELENHQYLYSSYHSLGLNGTGDRMHQIILEKPVKTL